jgi:hypothetical protein
MILQHTSIIAPFSPAMASADTNMSNTGHNNRFNFHFSADTSNSLCSCDNFNLDRAVVDEVLTCRACRRAPTPRQIFNAQERHNALATTANNERDAAIARRDADVMSANNERDEAIAKVLAANNERDFQVSQANKERDFQVSQVNNERDFLVSAAQSQRDWYAKAAIREHDIAMAQVTAVITERDAAMAQVTAVMNERDAAIDQLGIVIDQRDTARDERDTAMARVKQLEQMLGLRSHSIAFSPRLLYLKSDHFLPLHVLLGMPTEEFIEGLCRSV